LTLAPLSSAWSNGQLALPGGALVCYNHLLVEGDVEQGIRIAAFAHLDRLVAASPDGALRSRDVNTFVFEGRPIPLIVQSGIWKPAMLDAALTIRTTFIRTDRDRPYEDQIGDDGLLRYKYRGVDPNHSDNRPEDRRRRVAAKVPSMSS
jgi:hypothetical protein